MPSPITMSVSQTAAYFASALGGKTELWVSWLKNDRRPGRANCLAVEPGPGRPRYSKARVDSYIAELKAKRPRIQERIRVAPRTQSPALLQHAEVLDDDELREQLDAALQVSASMDLVAFEVMAGRNRFQQPTIWVRSGLRAGAHCAIVVPSFSEVDAAEHGRSELTEFKAGKG